jgi:hypothetical protein
MPYVLGILNRTPPWVFLLFAYLAWQGIKALRPRTQSIWRLLIVPLIFIVWGLSRIGMRHDNAWPPLVWVTAAVLMAPLAFLTGPRLLAVDRSRGLVSRAGSIVPLVRNMAVFGLQYAVAVMGALRLDGYAAGAIVGRAVSGATAGYFLGWAVALLRRYWNAENPPDTEAPSVHGAEPGG